MNNNSDLSMPIDIIYSELATIWLKVKQKQLKQSSISDYEFILKNYILNTFGKIPAQEIDENAIQEQIEEWATTNSLSGKQISYSTMKLIKTVLKGSLYFYRTETKQIPLNFSMIRIPKTRKVEISIFTKG